MKIQHELNIDKEIISKQLFQNREMNPLLEATETLYYATCY